MRGEHGIHLTKLAMVLDADVGHGQHPRREILCRGNGTLQGVGVETHGAFKRNLVFLHQSLADEPFAEILTHHRQGNGLGQKMGVKRQAKENTEWFYML